MCQINRFHWFLMFADEGIYLAFCLFIINQIKSLYKMGKKLKFSRDMDQQIIEAVDKVGRIQGKIVWVLVRNFCSQKFGLKLSSRQIMHRYNAILDPNFDHTIKLRPEQKIKVLLEYNLGKSNFQIRQTINEPKFSDNGIKMCVKSQKQSIFRQVIQMFPKRLGYLKKDGVKSKDCFRFMLVLVKNKRLLKYYSQGQQKPLIGQLLDLTKQYKSKTEKLKKETIKKQSIYYSGDQDKSIQKDAHDNELEAIKEQTLPILQKIVKLYDHLSQSQHCVYSKNTKNITNFNAARAFITGQPLKTQVFSDDQGPTHQVQKGSYQNEDDYIYSSENSEFFQNSPSPHIQRPIESIDACQRKDKGFSLGHLQTGVFESKNKFGEGPFEEGDQIQIQKENYEEFSESISPAHEEIFQEDEQALLREISTQTHERKKCINPQFSISISMGIRITGVN